MEHSVILVSIDTLRADVFGAVPTPRWTTLYPTLERPDSHVLDAIAALGTLYVNAVSAAPYTSSSHASYLTGRFPTTSGVDAFYAGRLARPNLFSIARDRGVRTLLKSDFPLILGRRLGFVDDVDEYLVDDDHAFLDRLTDAGQVIAMCHLAGMHPPYGFQNLRYGGESYRDEVRRLEALVPADVPVSKDQIVEADLDADDADLLFRYKRCIQYFYRERAYEFLFDLYLRGAERFLQCRLGRFVDQLVSILEASRRPYVLVVFGDHGHEYSDVSCGHFNSVSEGVLKVPVLLVGDGVDAGRVCHQRVRTVDLLPTVCDLVGWSCPPCDGHSLRDAAYRFNLPAIAQVVTSRTDEFMRFQVSELRGEETASLEHFKLADVVYLGQDRVTSRYLRYSPEFDLLAESSGLRTERVETAGPVDADVADLAAFAIGLAASGGSADRRGIDTTILSQLRASGYPL